MDELNIFLSCRFRVWSNALVEFFSGRSENIYSSKCQNCEKNFVHLRNFFLDGQKNLKISPVDWNHVELDIKTISFLIRWHKWYWDLVSNWLSETKSVEVKWHEEVFEFVFNRAFWKLKSQKIKQIIDLFLISKFYIEIHPSTFFVRYIHAFRRLLLHSNQKIMFIRINLPTTLISMQIHLL